jgi:hypothetical protein
LTYLGENEAAPKQIFADAGWQKSCATFRKMIRGGRREMHTVVE